MKAQGTRYKEQGTRHKEQGTSKAQGTSKEKAQAGIKEV